MALDRNYFNNIVLEPVRKKYYSIQDVDNLLMDMRNQANGMLREAEALSGRAFSAEQQADALRKENSELRTNAETLSREVSSLRAEVDELKLNNDSLRVVQKQAQQNARPMTNKEYRAALLARVEKFYVSTRDAYVSAISQLDDEWNSLSEETKAKVEEVPSDLSQKISSIARELEEIESLR